MKKRITFLLLFGTICTLWSFQSQTNTLPMPPNDYEAEWKIIDSLEQQGLPESALERVNSLYERAKSDDNAPQVIKTIIYKTKYTAQLQEDGQIAAMQLVQNEIEAATFPSTAILQSILAELYAQYLNNNIWRIRNRTNTAEVPDDIQTWSVDRLLAKSAALYLTSVETEGLRQISVENFEAILTEGQRNEGLRPTLYDFLAFRAIDFFMNERSYLTEPAFKFYIEQPVALAKVEDFVAATFETQDETSNKYRALLLLQEVLQFHSDDEQPDALVDADLKRLKFVHQNTIIENKDELYIQALDDLSRKYPNNSITAEVLHQKAQFYYQKGQSYEPKPEGVQDDAKFDLASAVELCENVIQNYPDSYGAEQCQALLQNIKRPILNFRTEEVNLPEQPFLLYLEYKNIPKVHLKAIPISEEEEQTFNRQNYEEKINYLNGQKAVNKWSIDLPDDKDFRQHSVEIPVEALPLGRYAILVSANENFAFGESPIGYIVTQVSNLGFWSRQHRTETEIIVMHRKTGEPLEDVQADFYTTEYNSQTRRSERKKILTLTSNENGFIRPQIDQNRSFVMRLQKGEDVLDLGDSFYNYYYSNESEDRAATHFFTDRAIYRPGQTVYFKGIALNYDKSRKPSIVANQEVTVTFFDVNYQEIEKQTFSTNEYGTFNGSFTTPRTGLLGQMHLQSNFGESREYFRVEEYKRPKFEVVFEPVQESYRLNDTVTVQGNAKAFAGSNVDGAKVQYRVVREVRFPWLPWWYRRYLPMGSSMEITNGTTQTNADGQFAIEFEAIPDRTVDAEQKPEFSYTVYADVTDITGETHSSETSVRVGYVALDVSLNVQEQINQATFDSIQVTTKNLNGEFEPAQGTISIEKLDMPERTFIDRYWEQPDKQLLSQSEFVEKFPHLAYADEDAMHNWAVEEQVLQTDFDTEKQDKVSAENLTAGAYALTLKTEDKYGTPVELKKYFTVYNTEKQEIPTTSIASIVVPKQQYEPGETAEIMVASAENDLNVLYEIERDGEIISQQWTSIDKVKTLTQKVTEADRGNFHVHLSYVRANRSQTPSYTFYVPWSNKELTIEYGTFRDKLRPGQEEEWQIKISGPKGEKVAAKMVATLYDASLDQFASHSWSGFNPYPTSYAQQGLQAAHFSDIYGRTSNQYDQSVSVEERIYRQLNWFYPRYSGGRNFAGGIQYTARSMEEAESDVMASAPMAKSAAPAMATEQMADMAGNAPAPPPSTYAQDTAEAPAPEQTTDFSDVKVRTNLNETVFFRPELRTDEDGNIIIKFTMNEALTRWKFLGFAHTKDLEFGLTQKEIVTQKELMVLPNPPRFMREDDQIEFTAKVSNLTEEELSGTAVLQLFDAATMQPVDSLFGLQTAEIPFLAKAGQSARLAWNLEVPSAAKVSGLVHRVVAKAGDFSDGEEDALPVLTNRMLVTESLPLPVRGKEKETFTFASLQNADRSNTLEHQSLALEFTSNPAWYAVQALPYLMEYPYECIEQQFNRYYANALATTVANAHPKVREVFQQWKDTDAGALSSNLSKNQELKSALLEETPWVLQAQSEEEQKRNIGLLFDLNRMAEEQQATLNKIIERQSQNGGFAWFPGGQESWYMTQYIVEGLGHLDKLNAADLQNNQQVQQVAQKAVQFIDAKMVEHYQELQQRLGNSNSKLDDDHLDPIAMHYLYARSFFKNLPMEKDVEKARDFYLAQAEKHWLGKGIYQEGMLALALQRFGKTAVPQQITKSLKERAIKNEELGMYWKNDAGYFWYQLPIESHALMIELFEEVAQDAEAVEELKIWLLKTKQTTHWKTTKATAAAVYALLMTGDDWLIQDEQVQINFENSGNPEIHSTKIQAAQQTAEAGTGYFKATWSADEITSDMAVIEVKNPNKTVAWGGVYWQYFEQLDKIETFEETPLTIKKELLKEINTARGTILESINEGSTLQPGDKLKVRIELRVDRPMEYVHMKDMRASGFEPINVLSQYKWQDGLGYYESTRDVSTNFFFSYLPQGTYVFEYPLRVVHEGDFSNGVTTIQCMYAPEFTSHSEGVRVQVR